jgi:pimeloyl-ACP methyl ester carboxylesterase
MALHRERVSYIPTAKPRHETIVLDDGFRVGVTRAGSRYGAPLVFLHGLGVSATAYTEMLELLAGCGFSVIALDAPDHGGTDSLPWGHTVADMVEITRRALDALGIRAAVMVGHSMGGAMVAEFAAQHPERAIAAILLDAAAGEAHHDAIRIGASPAVPLRAVQYFAGAWADVIGDGLRAWRVRSFKERQRLSRVLRQSVSGPNCTRAVYALMRHETEPLLTAMRDKAVPTVIVHGTRDRIVPVLAGANAARLSGGKLCLVEDGYHSWMLSEPKLAVNVINAAISNAAAARCVA